MKDSSAEQAILKILIHDNAQIMNVTINENHFTDSQNAQIFMAISAMLSSKKVVDVVTLAESMERGTGRDWLDYLVAITTEAAGSIINVSAYCKILEDLYLERSARLIAGDVMSKKTIGREEIAGVIRSLMALDETSQSNEYDLTQAMVIYREELERAISGESKGLTTGVQSLDEALGGFHESDLIVIGARPAMGKTALLINMMLANPGYPGLISGEQGVNQIIQRIMAIKSGVSLARMRSGDLNEQDFQNIQNGAVLLKQSRGMKIFDRSTPSIENIESCARRWKFEHNINALYVDYMQKIRRPKGTKKHEAVGDNAARLKDLAKELKIPIVVLAQVSRDVESRTNRRPLMGDLSDSSEIEKEADIIGMIYRDEVYNEQTQFPGVIEINIEKNRHGPTGLCNCYWDSKTLTVKNKESY